MTRFEVIRSYHAHTIIALVAIVITSVTSLRPTSADSATRAASAATNPAAPQLAVYRWAIKPANTDAFADWIGDPSVWAEDFPDTSSWDNIENPGWLLNP